jgi:hypothetical protein
MSIKAKIPSAKNYTANITQSASVRISKPKFDIKPNISLSNLTDAINTNAESEYALVYSSNSRKFVPTDITDIREDITTVNRIVGGNF